MRFSANKVIRALTIIVCLGVGKVWAQGPTENEIRTLIDSDFVSAQSIRMQGYDSKQLSKQLRSWYQENSFAPFWYQSGELSSRASELRAAVLKSADDGLQPGDYFLQKIDQLWTESAPAKLAELDLSLTLAALRLAADAEFGRFDLRKSDGKSFKGPALKSPDLEPILRNVMSRQDIGQALAQQFPRHRQYQRMKKALADYRALAAAGGWNVVPGKGAIRSGDSGPRVLALAQHLSTTGDLPAQIRPGEKFDVELEAAVRSFQQRHGLPVTGQVHDKTLEALNVPIERRIQSLLINLERWRWLSRDFDQEKEVYVNIAGYELFAISGPSIVLRMPVIVGKSYHATPVFSDQIEYIEFNPYWNVPVSIATNEMLPKLRKDPGYLEAEHLRLYPSSGTAREISPYSINWSSVGRSDVRRYLIRQDHGPWNVLGSLKFVFPNSYNVYLHDTSSRNLFAENSRAFSHGCIRVSNPIQLAVFLLNTPEDPWDTARVEEVIATTKNQNIRLPRPVPVHLTYRTAWVDLDNTVNFRPDLYRRDQAMIDVLGE